jgi:3-phosphoshikimate 1-carboxyvinyltransferase
MRIVIHKSAISGSVSAPPSKSYTIRALMCAALAQGDSVLSGALDSDDTRAAVNVLEQIGVKVAVQGDSWTVSGGELKVLQYELFCADSAAVIRFMSAICAMLPGCSLLTGNPGLLRRPIKPLVSALREWGIDASCQGDNPPVTVSGEGFKGGITHLPGNISSQFVSALLLIAPLADKDAYIWLTTPLESAAYVAMTLECLEKFGIKVRTTREMMEFETSPQKYSPAVYKVEGDWSSASYALTLGAVAGETSVENLDPLSLQSDKEMVQILRKTGAAVAVGLDAVRVSRKQLKPFKVDLNESIDLLPTVAVLAALTEGECILTGIKRARLKESDRVAVVLEELSKCGVSAEVEGNSLKIRGGTVQPAIIDSHNDHRIAMAFSILGAAAGGITVEGAECVAKTYPEYWRDLGRLGVKLDEQ